MWPSRESNLRSSHILRNALPSELSRYNYLTGTFPHYTCWPFIPFCTNETWKMRERSFHGLTLWVWGISLSYFKSAMCRMGWKDNTYNVGICLSGNRTWFKVSGSIPGSHFWFKNYLAFYSSFSAIIIAEEIFCQNLQCLLIFSLLQNT